MESTEKYSNLKNAIVFIGSGVLFIALALGGIMFYKSHLEHEAARQNSQNELAKAIAEVKATVTYKIASIEAGRELDVSDPEISDLALTIFHAAKFFNTTEDKIGNIAYHHSVELKKQGINVSVKTLLEEGMFAFAGPNSLIDTPGIETFNLFGAMYNVMSKQSTH